MDNEQLEIGNAVGERTCLRESAPAAGWNEQGSRGTNVLTETRESGVESVRGAIG